MIPQVLPKTFHKHTNLTPTHHAQIHRTLVKLAATTQQPTEGATPSSRPSPPSPSSSNDTAITPDWQNAIHYQESGKLFTAKVKWANRSGITVQLGKLSAFVPYTLLDRRRLEKAKLEEGITDTKSSPTGFQSLCGQDITLKVTQVIVPERRLICSEKAALNTKLASLVAPGDVIRGRVASLHEFGAFVEVQEPSEGAGAEVMIPLREISWEWIPTPNAALQKGQEVAVRVMAVAPEPKLKVIVSLKRMQQDPLQENLDSVLPLDAVTMGSYDEMEYVPTDMPSGLEDILGGLLAEPGVEAVNVGRRVEEKRTVSQDLELWLTKDTIVDGYNLVARAGKMVQEIHVVSSMDRREMKDAVQRVLRKVT